MDAMTCTVKALRAEARRLKIRNRSLMTVGALRTFVAGELAWEAHPDNPRNTSTI